MSPLLFHTIISHDFIYFRHSIFTLVNWPADPSNRPKAMIIRIIHFYINQMNCKISTLARFIVISLRMISSSKGVFQFFDSSFVRKMNRYVVIWVRCLDCVSWLVDEVLFMKCTEKIDHFSCDFAVCYYNWLLKFVYKNKLYLCKKNIRFLFFN